MNAPNAYISIDEIVTSYMLKKGYPMHYYYIIAKLATDCVRQLQLSYLPMPRHTVLSKTDSEAWFTLPDGFSDYISVGIIVGERWRPVAVSKSLMGMPNEKGGGEYNMSTNTDEYNNSEGWTTWVNPDYASLVPSFGSDFGSSDFQTTPTSLGVDEQSGVTNLSGWYYPFGYNLWTAERYNDYWESKGRYYGGVNAIRNDSVQFVLDKNIIMCSQYFPSNHLYLIWTGVGNIDTMTYIPLVAQDAIEAHIDWKYKANKSNTPLGEKRDAERNYYIEERKMMIRLDDFGRTEMNRLLSKNFRRTKL